MSTVSLYHPASGLGEKHWEIRGTKSRFRVLLLKHSFYTRTHPVRRRLPWKERLPCLVKAGGRQFVFYSTLSEIQARLTSHNRRPWSELPAGANVESTELTESYRPSTSIYFKDSWRIRTINVGDGSAAGSCALPQKLLILFIVFIFPQPRERILCPWLTLHNKKMESCLP